MSETAKNIWSPVIDKDLENNLKICSQLIDNYLKCGNTIFLLLDNKDYQGDEMLLVQSFFIDFLEEADAASVLIRQSSVEPVKQILRGLFKTYLFMKYYLSGKTKLKYKYYICAKSKQYLNANKKYNVSDNDKYDSEKNDFIFDDEDADNAKDSTYREVEALLESTEYSELSIEYDYQNIEHWFSFDRGPQDMAELADRLGHSEKYEMFFNEFADSVHSENVLLSKATGNTGGRAWDNPVRYPINVKKVTEQIIKICDIFHKIVIEKLLPKKQDWYKTWKYKEIIPLMKQLNEWEEIG